MSFENLIAGTSVGQINSDGTFVWDGQLWSPIQDNADNFYRIPEETTQTIVNALLTLGSPGFVRENTDGSVVKSVLSNYYTIVYGSTAVTIHSGETASGTVFATRNYVET